MAILRKEESGDDLRRRLLEEAAEYRRRHPLPPVKEVLAEAQRIRESLPKDFKALDSVALLREDRER